MSSQPQSQQQNQRQRQRQPSLAEVEFLQNRAKEQQILNEKLSQHVQSYPIRLLFPADVSASPDESSESNSASDTTDAATKPLRRTSPDLINYRLLETVGLDFTPDENESINPNNNDSSTSSSTITLAETTQALNHFVKDLERTNCYNSVQVLLGNQDRKGDSAIVGSGENGDGICPKKVNVVLNEKNWYKLYIGGGIKHDNAAAAATTSFPKVQFETSASLINLTGLTDYTQCSYTIDQTSTPTLSLTHTRPLYSLFDTNNSVIGDTILNMNQGSKIGITFRANIDTLDYEHTRSSKDYIQSIGMKIANSTPHSSSMNAAMSEDVYLGLDWSLSHRDVIPRRSTTSPFLCDASPDIIACGGQSWKHSVSAEYKMNGFYTDSKYDPTVGIDSYGGVELAGPPGDVGFLKCWAGGSVHVPLGEVDGADSSNSDNDDYVSPKSKGGLISSILPRGLSLHTAYSFGMIKSLSYGGLCTSGGDMTNISDRFYIGGSHQLRGFLPAGIGPRSDEVSYTKP